MDTMENIELLNAWYEKVKQLVRYNKAKDEIIEKTGKDIQRYREGFVSQAFKPLAVSLIDFREAAKKEMESLEKYEFTADKLKKNYDLLIDDLGEVLSQNGVEQTDDGVWTYDGCDMSAPISLGEAEAAEAEVAATETEMTEAEAEAAEAEATEENGEESKEETFAEKLDRYYAELTQILRENAVLEGIVSSAFSRAREIDARNKKLFIYPVIRKVVSIQEKLSETYRAFPASEENAKEEYAAVLGGVVADAEEALSLMGVTIVGNPNDTFDSAFHSLLKTIVTDREEEDRKIAAVRSDAYELDGKIIYRQKVEVFKYKK